MAKADHLPIFLKSVTIQGFKSFADRVKFELQHGLSVIVGPNGSGKSNVADAVRWVLGEQSVKSLRGSRMEDIIFAGSSGRRSVGMAEVSLTFDNSSAIFPLDFQEVTVTRRVFRDGEGHFFINRSPCRLKDLQELFLDTGAGKEGFSIIGQGRVEEILNSKPEERRLILEEASGISKYRVRKRETLKRLEDTEHNLERLADIVQEIEGQLEPLAIQAQTARQSLSLQEELHKLEIQWIVEDLTGVRRKLAASREEEASLHLTQTKAQAELALAEGQSQNLKLKEKQLEESVQAQQNDVFQAEQACSMLENQLNILRERSGNTEEQVERLAEETAQEYIRKQEMKGKIQALSGKQALLRQTVAEAAKEGKVLEEALHQARSRNGLESLEQVKGELFAALSEQAGCSNELTGIRHTLGTLEQQLLDLEKTKAGQAERLAAIREEMALKQAGLEQLAGKEAGLSKEEESLRTELNQTAAQAMRSESTLTELKGRVERLRAKHQALASLAESLEGYARGVRELLTAKKKGHPACQGLCGTVADLIETEEEYELAVETALGGALQDIVAESLEEAKRGIAYLKAQKAGWATFLPLDTVKGGRQAVGAVSGDAGFVGLAIELVHFAESYRPALEHLLGRVLIVRDMEAATRVAKATAYRLRVVTVEGDQIHPGGTLTGGSMQRRSGNFLGRHRELSALEQELKALEEERRENAQDFQVLQEKRQELEQSLKRLGEERQGLKEEGAVLRVNSENLEVQLRRSEEDLSLTQLRERELVIGREESGRQLENALEQMKRSEERAFGLRQKMERMDAEAQSAAGESERLAEALTEAKVQLAKWDEELRQSAALLEQEKLREAEQARNLREREARLLDLKGNLEKIRTERESLDLDLAQTQNGRAVQQLRLVELRQERELVSAHSREAEEQAVKSRKQVASFDQRLHNLEVVLARWQTEWEGGLARLVREFALSWEEALPYQAEIEREMIQTRIEEIRRELEELGPVNQAAVTEYPKLLERREFLLAQRQDLVEADGKLRELIAELDHTMSERFKEGFEAVNTAFQRVFQELFQGGQAELRLVEPDNLLETGVEIVAQPPGKKLQWLSLLSGGERALTAIALLFALLHVKPSPFCLLDEIEASLDDANVKRFADYIHKLSASTQFIVISHRKGTMEAADVLYGIAMEESGVSKLLTVQLEEGDVAPVSA